jgi:GxxExxY protein
MIELFKQGLDCKQQHKIKVYYEGKEVGDYTADIIVNNCVIVELKAAVCLTSDHQAQLINYLRATNLEVGLLLNFGNKPEHKRCAFSNEYKKSMFPK